MDFPVKTSNIYSSKNSVDLPSDLYSKVMRVGQRQGIISTAKSNHSIISTDALSTCVGVLGYSKENKQGFLLHVDALTDFSFEWEDIYNETIDPLPSLNQIALQSDAKKGILQYDVQIIQGTVYKLLLDEVEFRVNYMNNKFADKIHLNVISRDVEEKECFRTKSVALDLRSGNCYTFNPPRESLKNIAKIPRILTGMPSPLDWTYDKTI